MNSHIEDGTFLLEYDNNVIFDFVNGLNMCTPSAQIIFENMPVKKFKSFRNKYIVKESNLIPAISISRAVKNVVPIECFENCKNKYFSIYFNKVKQFNDTAETIYIMAELFKKKTAGFDNSRDIAFETSETCKVDLKECSCVFRIHSQFTEIKLPLFTAQANYNYYLYFQIYSNNAISKQTPQSIKYCATIHTSIE